MSIMNEMENERLCLEVKEKYNDKEHEYINEIDSFVWSMSSKNIKNKSKINNLKWFKETTKDYLESIKLLNYDLIGDGYKKEKDIDVESYICKKSIVFQYMFVINEYGPTLYKNYKYDCYIRSIMRPLKYNLQYFINELTNKNAKDCLPDYLYEKLKDLYNDILNNNEF